MALNRCIELYWCTHGNTYTQPPVTGTLQNLQAAVYPKKRTHTMQCRWQALSVGKGNFVIKENFSFLVMSKIFNLTIIENAVCTFVWKLLQSFCTNRHCSLRQTETLVTLRGATGAHLFHQTLGVFKKTISYLPKLQCHLPKRTKYLKKNTTRLFTKSSNFTKYLMILTNNPANLVNSSRFWQINLGILINKSQFWQITQWIWQLPSEPLWIP